jgi:hypothetical protein
MPVITLAQAEANLTEALAARSAVMTGGQAYSMGRSVTRADLKAINEDIKFWNGEVQRLSSASGRGIKVFGGVCLD